MKYIFNRSAWLCNRLAAIGLWISEHNTE